MKRSDWRRNMHVKTKYYQYGRTARGTLPYPPFMYKGRYYASFTYGSGCSVYVPIRYIDIGR
jgi:hypothetical protein